MTNYLSSFYRKQMPAADFFIKFVVFLSLFRFACHLFLSSLSCPAVISSGNKRSFLYRGRNFFDCCLWLLFVFFSFVYMEYRIKKVRRQSLFLEGVKYQIILNDTYHNGLVQGFPKSSILTPWGRNRFF